MLSNKCADAVYVVCNRPVYLKTLLYVYCVIGAIGMSRSVVLFLLCVHVSKCCYVLCCV